MLQQRDQTNTCGHIGRIILDSFGQQGDGFVLLVVVGQAVGFLEADTAQVVANGFPRLHDINQANSDSDNSDAEGPDQFLPE